MESDGSDEETQAGGEEGDVVCCKIFWKNMNPNDKTRLVCETCWCFKICVLLFFSPFFVKSLNDLVTTIR